MKFSVVGVQLALCAFFCFVSNAALSPIKTDPNGVFSEKDVEALKEAFKLFDDDGDGIINRNDVRKVLDALEEHPTEEELDEMIKDVDVDGDGSIGFEEFLKMMADGVKDAEEDLKESFRGFDKDGDGFITKCELRNVLIEIGKRPTRLLVRHLIAVADCNGDGKVDFDEFKRVMTGFPKNAEDMNEVKPTKEEKDEEL